MPRAAADRVLTPAEQAMFQAVAADDGGALMTEFLRGASPNVRDAQGQTPLTLALRDGRALAVARLLEHPDLKADLPNAKDETPLMMAALRGRTDWMARLVQRGAALNREGWAPLHYAASHPSGEALDWLVGKGADLNARSPNGTTPLMMAARYGDERAVLRLLEHGAEPRAHNERDLNAADFARAAGRGVLAERLEREMKAVAAEAARPSRR